MKRRFVAICVAAALLAAAWFVLQAGAENTRAVPLAIEGVAATRPWVRYPGWPARVF
jgi:hypothetical protein